MKQTTVSFSGFNPKLAEAKCNSCLLYSCIVTRATKILGYIVEIPYILDNSYVNLSILKLVNCSEHNRSVKRLLLDVFVYTFYVLPIQLIQYTKTSRRKKKESFNTKVRFTTIDKLEYGQINITVIQYLRNFDDIPKRIFETHVTMQLYNKQLSHFASVYFNLKLENETVICIMRKTLSELKCQRENCGCRNVEYYQEHKPSEEPCVHLRVGIKQYIYSFS